MAPKTSQPAEPQGVAELLERARGGDRAAEERLFELLSARILALAKKRLWDEELARDVTQETMKTVFEKYREVALPRGLLPWVFAILRNKVGNALKRRRVEGRHVMRGGALLDWETAGVSAESETGAVDLSVSLERALRRASPECRRIFRTLLRGGGRPAILELFPGESTGTIDSRISRCREKLLRWLEARGREEGA